MKIEKVEKSENQTKMSNEDVNEMKSNFEKSSWQLSQLDQQLSNVEVPDENAWLVRPEFHFENHHHENVNVENQ